MSRVIIVLMGLLLFLFVPSRNCLAQDERTGLPIAFWGPWQVSTAVYDSRDLVVEAVYQATTLSGGAAIGQVVKTGTLQQGFGGIQYLPTPKDRLVVKIKKDVHEFVVKEAQGNTLAATAGDWLSSNHILNYTHTLKGKAEVKVSIRFLGTSFSVAVQGWSMWSGMRYDMALTITGKSKSERDYHGQEIKTEFLVKGKIKGEGVEIDVNEQRSYEMASAQSLRLLYSQRGSAYRVKALLNNTLRIKDAVYKINNVKAQFDNKTKGGQTQSGITHLEGEVLKGGKPFGRCALKGGKVQVVTSSGAIPLDLPKLDPINPE